MSRVGKLPIPIPQGVSVEINKNAVAVKGPKGELARDFPAEIELKEENGELLVTRNSDHRIHRSKHGLSRALLNNMVVGVSEGFKKELQIEGVGYRATVEDKNLVMNLGYSHQVIFEPPEGITFDVDKPGRLVSVSGVDKELVGEIAARIRRKRPPEPYKGKGVRYVGERVRRKAGKAGKAK